MQQHLKDAETFAKEKANVKAPDAAAIKDKIQEVVGGSGGGGDKARHEEAPGQFNAMDEIDTILKRSPVVIISKSYCPHSKKAKRLLLESYKIVPAPFVSLS